MTDLEIEEKVKQINELLEKKQVTILDDYFHDVYQDKYTNEIFRVKSQRFFDSQDDANHALEETLLKLLAFEG